MDRSREARRSGMVSAATSNGLSRRRHRSNSLRDSPDEDGGVEIQESVRLRERVKKDRDRGDNRERDRERDNRDRTAASRSKRRRRGDRLMMQGDDSSEESVNDEEDDDDEDTTTTTNVVSGSSTRLLPPAAPVTAPSTVGSVSNHHHHYHHHNNHHLQPPRKSFAPNAVKVFRAAPPVWKPGDEMIGVSVPRKARSACTKRSHDWISGISGVGGGNIGGVVTGDQINQQVYTSSSPVRQNISVASTPSPAAPLSPSSSNVSARKKIKPSSGAKRPPPAAKSPPEASSSNPEELEIAEVLFGLRTQSQGPSKKENGGPNDVTREVNNRSRVSSPVSNSNSSATPLSAVAPKRKRPRQVLENPGGVGMKSSPISAQVEMETTMKIEVSSPNLEKTPQSAAENVVSLYDLTASAQSLPVPSDPSPEPMKVEPDAKRRPAESEFMESKEKVSSPKMDSSAVGAKSSNHVDAGAGTGASVTVAQVSSIVPEVESQRVEKFQIDLMAPPPQLKSSPEREAEMNFGSSAAVDNKAIIAEKIVEMKLGLKEKDDEKINKAEVEERISVAAEDKKTKAALEEMNSRKTSDSSSRGRNLDLQLDLEKPEKDSGVSSKFQQQSQKLQLEQHQPSPSQEVTKEESIRDKSGQSSSLPIPMSMPSWPGGLPPMRYMAPLQGVVTMDGTTVSSAPIQPLFSQPRPKRCATHFYVARNIHYLQQFMKMNPFWPPAAAAASSASFFGPKGNLNVMPPTDLHVNLAGRGAGAGPEKAQGLAIFPGSNGGKDKAQPANIVDAAQRKQPILLQQALPPVAPNNLLHGPAFIFPINQQQAAAAASLRPGPAKSPSATGGAVSSSTSNHSVGTASATTGGAATAISFNYPNMSPNEAQYLAILQNNAYAFPIPAVGAPPNYRGTHPQPMPLFNGSFYSSQMIHPSQVQQQQQQQQPPTSLSQQMQQGQQQNTSMSSGSSSSHKHLQSQQQQRSQGNAVNGASSGGNLHNFPGTKNHHLAPSPAQSQNHHVLPQTRHNENEVGSEDSPSNTERKRAHGSINMYNQNFAMPMPLSNFSLMTPSAPFGVTTSSGGGSNHQSEKKPQQQLQPGVKTSQESVPPQPFAMSFASFNGATGAPGIDMSMAQNHAIFQSLPEATRQNLQMAAAAAQAVQHKKNFRISEDSKSGSGDQTGADTERKGLAMKPSGNTGQSIAFSRSDMSDAPGSTIAANNVIDSSSRSLNIPSGASFNSRPGMPNAMGGVNVPSAQLQAQIQHQQQQMIQLHKQQQQQQQMAAAVARSKTPASSNGNVYSDHLTSSASAASKFPNAMSTFPQNHVQTGNGSSQSAQWKSSTRTSTSQPPPSMSSTSSLKSLSQQQQVRSQQSNTQISFGTNQKSAAQQGQQPPNSIQSPSSPMMVGSPTTSSISKGAGGSPRTTNSGSTSNKTGGQNSSLSTQQGKSTSSVPNQKSSPAGGRNVPSILGNPHIASSGGGAKSQLLQQQQQQHMQKGMQQAQLFFSSQFMQAQPPHSSGTSSTGQATGGYYLHRRRSDQPAQQQPGSSSSGMLTLCPITLADGTPSDPAKAIAAAAATSNMKGGALSSQGILHAAQYATPTSGGQNQLLPAGFSYVHPVPAAVQVKPAEQKQPAGNDNLHACWQPEKK